MSYRGTVNTNVQKSNGLEWIAAIMLFLFIPPYFMWGIMSSYYLSIPLTLLLCVLFYMNKRRFSKTDKKLILLFAITLLYYTFNGLLHGTNIMGGIARLLVLAYIAVPFAKETFSKQVYNKFLSIISIVLSISILSYILSRTGIISPIGEISRMEGDILESFDVYPLLVAERGFDFLRFYGPFSEPGTVGTLSAILMCVQRFNFKDIRIIPIFISGLLSFSLFFYVLVLVYGCIYFLTVRKNYFIIILFAALISGFYIATKDDPILYTLIWERIEWDEDNQQFKGDSRKSVWVDDYYDKFKKTPQYWTGSSKKEVAQFWNYVESTSSYKVVVVTDGIIFVVLYLLFFIIYAFHYRRSNKEFLLFLFVLLANFYQRPNVYNILYLFLYTYLAGPAISIDVVQRAVKQAKNKKVLPVTGN